MSCHPSAPEMHQHGALPPEIVAGLSGIEPAQLECWRADGLLPAFLSKADVEPFCDDDDPDWFYTLDDLARVLAAAKLLQLGLPKTELPAALARLDETGECWAVDVFPLQIEDAFPENLDLIQFASERWHEGHLGRLYEYADVVELKPDVMGSMPVIRGRRIDTNTVICSYRDDSDIPRITAGYRLTPYQIRRAVAFERALREFEATDASAAR